jgi:predicted Zn finger-like uncharacterized protein
LIRFACPACQTSYDVPDDVAGRKTNCRKCGQRLQVPALPNKTVLAPLLQHKPDVGSPSLPPAAPPPNAPVPQQVSPEQLTRGLSLAGAIVLTLGVFCPILQVPLLGGISLFDWNIHAITNDWRQPSNERDQRGREREGSDKGEQRKGDDSDYVVLGFVAAIAALCSMLAAIACAFTFALGNVPHHVRFIPPDGAFKLASTSVALTALPIILRMWEFRAFVRVGWGWGVLAVGIGLLFATSHVAAMADGSPRTKQHRRMIRFPCPNCKFGLSAPAEKSGQESRCPKCGQSVVVP